MPLSDTTLAAAIKANLLADANSRAVNNAALDALCSAVAKAVVSHITSAGVVVPTALIAPPGTAGGPVTGTGSIT